MQSGSTRPREGASPQRQCADHVPIRESDGPHHKSPAVGPFTHLEASLRTGAGCARQSRFFSRASRSQSLFVRSGTRGSAKSARSSNHVPACVSLWNSISRASDLRSHDPLAGPLAEGSDFTTDRCSVVFRLQSFFQSQGVRARAQHFSSGRSTVTAASDKRGSISGRCIQCVGKNPGEFPARECASMVHQSRSVSSI